MWHTCQQALNNSSVADVMPFHNREVLGQEGTHGRIATVWFHWADCVRVVVPGMLRTCRTRIFYRTVRNISGIQAEVKGCDKKKKAVGSRSACASLASDF